MNLYELHNKPKELIGWIDRIKIPKYAWKEAEPYIAQDTDAAFDYSFTTLRDRFEAGEPAIRKDKFKWFRYHNNFGKKYNIKMDLENG